MGAASARNTALDAAQGEYIAFVDSDDEITSSFTQILLDIAYKNNADIVKCHYGLKSGGSLLGYYEASGYVWGGVYHRKIFQRVRFPYSYWYEDMINPFLMRSQAEHLIYVDDILYFKGQHANNISTVLWSPKQYQCLEQVYLAKSLISDYRKLGLTDEDYLFRCALNECSALAFSRTRKLDTATRQQIFLACSEMVSSFHSTASGLSLKQKVFYDALISKDFIAWELAALASLG